MVWLDLGNCAAMMFVDECGTFINELNDSNLVCLTELTGMSIYKCFGWKF